MKPKTAPRRGRPSPAGRCSSLFHEGRGRSAQEKETAGPLFSQPRKTFFSPLARRRAKRREKEEGFRRPFSTKTSHEDLSATALARFKRRGPCPISWGGWEFFAEEHHKKRDKNSFKMNNHSGAGRTAPHPRPRAIAILRCLRRGFARAGGRAKSAPKGRKGRRFWGFPVVGPSGKFHQTENRDERRAGNIRKMEKILISAILATKYDRILKGTRVR